MIKKSLSALALLAPCLAYGADPSGSVSVEVVLLISIELGPC